MAWNRDRCHAEKECCPGPPNDWSSQQRLQVPDQPGALLRGAHIGGFQSGAAAFLPHRQRSEAELRLSTTGGERGFAEVFRTVWAAAGLSRTQLPKQRSRRRPHRPSIVSGIALNSMWTRWFAQYPVRPTANVPAIRDLLCGATSRQLFSCYHRATKPHLRRPFTRNEGVPGSSPGVGLAPAVHESDPLNDRPEPSRRSGEPTLGIDLRSAAVDRRFVTLVLRRGALLGLVALLVAIVSGFGARGSRQPPGKIVFAARAHLGGGSDIYSVNADGTRLRRLTTGSAEEDNPTWSPNGRSIAYV